MPRPLPNPTPEADVTAARRAAHFTAPMIEGRIEEAVEMLVHAGAIPETGWRLLAHVLFCRAVYAQHVEPLEKHLTFGEIANHLEELGVPRFRGSNEWTPAAISELRSVVASPHNKISLPDM